MDKQTSTQKESTAKRGRSPDRSEAQRTGESPSAVRSSSPQVPLKKRRFILADQPETTPATTITKQRTAEVHSEVAMPPPSTVPAPISAAAVRPPQQSARPAASTQSLSTDNLLYNFLKTLPPGFDIAKAVADIQAELASIEFSTGPAADQLGEDEGMSNPHDDEGAETSAGLSKEVEAQSIQPSTAQIQQETAQAEVYLDQQGETGFSSLPAGEAPLTVEDYLEARSPVQENRSPVQEPGLGAQGASQVMQQSDSPVRRDGEETAVTSSSGTTIVQETPSPVREPSVGTVPQAEGGPELEKSVPLAEGELEKNITPQAEDCPDTPVFNRELDFAETPQHEGELDGKTASSSEKVRASASPKSVKGGEADKAPGGGGAMVNVIDLDADDEGTNQVGSPKQGGGHDWNPMTHLESEAENEDTAPLNTSRRNRRLNFEEGDGGSANITQAPPTQQEEEINVEEIDEERLRQERKRKGKDLATEKSKRKRSRLRQFARPVNSGIVITEPTPRHQEVDSAAGEHQATPKERPPTPPGQDFIPTFTKIPVLITNRLLEKMTKFPNKKWEEECAQRVTLTKKLKTGKMIHNPSLQTLEVESEFLQYLTGIGFEWLLDLNSPQVPVELAKEFFTSFRLSKVKDLQSKCISFRLFNMPMTMSLTEWSVRLGIYTTEQAIHGDWFGRHFGPPRSHQQFDPQVAWRSITRRGAPDFIPSTSSAIHVRDPALRLAQVFLGYNLLGQANTSASITLAELFFMWCMKEQIKVHIGYWLAHSCHQIATHPTRHLNICHILDPLIRNGFIAKVKKGSKLEFCPDPELFDINFFARVKIIKAIDDEIVFYPKFTHARPASPARERGSPPIEQAQPQARIAQTKKTPETRMVVAHTEERETGPSGARRSRVEELLTQLVDIAEAQNAQIARAVEVMEEMLLAVRQGTVPAPRPTPNTPRSDQANPRQRRQ